MEVKAIAKRWGNSLAVIIPKDVVEKEELRENQQVIFDVRPQGLRAKEVFGLLKSWKRPTQEIKDKVRRGWESSADRKRWKRA